MNWIKKKWIEFRLWISDHGEKGKATFYAPMQTVIKKGTTIRLEWPGRKGHNYMITSDAKVGEDGNVTIEVKRVGSFIDELVGMIRRWWKETKRVWNDPRFRMREHGVNDVSAPSVRPSPPRGQGVVGK